MDYKNDVRIIKALTDENRLAILHMLQDGSKCACVILEELHITQPTLSHHMKILCDSGIVVSRQEGKWMHYRLSQVREVDVLFAVAGRRQDAARTGRAVHHQRRSLCGLQNLRVLQG